MSRMATRSERPEHQHEPRATDFQWLRFEGLLRSKGSSQERESITTVGTSQVDIRLDSALNNEVDSAVRAREPEPRMSTSLQLDAVMIRLALKRLWLLLDVKHLQSSQASISTCRRAFIKVKDDLALQQEDRCRDRHGIIFPSNLSISPQTN